MGRLLLFALALFGCGMAVTRSRPPVGRVAALAGDATPPAATPTLAFHPGEPAVRLDNAATLTRGASGHFIVSVSVNGQPIDMVVDTGASAIALTVADAQRLGIAVDPAQFRVVGSGASGPVMGQVATLGDVAVGDRHVGQVEAVVLQGLDRSLLGQSYLRRLDRVAIEGDTMTLR